MVYVWYYVYIYHLPTVYMLYQYCTTNGTEWIRNGVVHTSKMDGFYTTFCKSMESEDLRALITLSGGPPERVVGTVSTHCVAYSVSSTWSMYCIMYIITCIHCVAYGITTAIMRAERGARRW